MMIVRKINVIKNKVLETPEFIPSLTSIKRYSNYFDLLSYLTSQKISHYMISAYDLYYLEEDIPSEIKNQIANNSHLSFLDSGAFEIYNGIFSKDWNNELLIKIVKELNTDVVVSLDHIRINIDNSYLDDLSNYNDMKNKLRENKQFYEVVIQGRNIKAIKLFLENLEIDKKLLAICVPERNLGNAFTTRHENLKALLILIKKEFGFEELLFHLMGCSHPLLLQKYGDLGVDLFDGIHWHDSLLIPSKTYFTDLCQLMEINCSCSYCNELRDIRKINKNDFNNYYMYYALSHNLLLFKNIMKNLRNE